MDMAIPQGTKDFVPFVSKIPGDTEGVYYLFFGADLLSEAEHHLAPRVWDPTVHKARNR